MAQNRRATYSELLKIGAVIGAIIVSVGSYRVQQDPHARPDPFTGTQAQDHARRIENLEAWRQRHIVWSRQLAGANDAYHEEFKRRLLDIEKKLSRSHRHNETR